jgi:hypothetical protein
MEAHKSGQIRTLLQLVDELPQELLRMDGETYTQYVACRMEIEHVSSDWAHGNTNPRSFNPVAGSKDHPIELLRNALSNCPDSAPAPGSAELEFMDDVPLRDQLRIDMTDAYRALHSGEWKAATVLAGSVMEALLLWGLNKTTRPTVEAAYGAAGTKIPSPKPFDEWLLWQFIDAARVADLIDDSTQKQAELAQDFRNLIHPGRAARLKDGCDRGTSHGAIAGMERVASAFAARKW